MVTVNLIFSSGHIQTEEVPHLITLTELELGGNITFNCSVSKEIRFRHWYKQSLGKMVQTVGSGVYGQIKQIEPFKNPRFQIHEGNGRWLLTITSVSKEDEAVYFCQSGSEYLQTFINGFFLAVKGNKQFMVFLSISWTCESYCTLAILQTSIKIFHRL